MFGEIRNSQGERLDYTFHEGEAGSRNIVVIGHGVTGNKDRPFVIALAEGLVAAGIHVLRFSFAGNGDSEGKFVDCTISKEVEDLGAVLDALDDYNVCYAGHSMGGAVGVLRAAADPRIKYLISLAGMVHTQAFAEREFGMETPDEGCMWEEPSCPLSSTYMKDMAGIGSVIDKAPHIKVPWLLVHGSEDDVVPLQDSKDIQAKADPQPALEVLEGADHVFGEAATEPMVKAVISWLRQEMK